MASQQENQEQNQEQSQGQSQGQDDRDKDVLTKDDFQKLEQQEAKKNIFKRVFDGLRKKSKSQKQEQSEEQSQEEKEKQESAPISFNEMINEFYNINQRFDNLLIQVEKQSGRVDMVEESKKAMDDKIANLTTQIGELRSNLVSRERFFEKMENEFEEMKQVMAKARPKEIDRRFKQVDDYLRKLYTKIGQFQQSLNERAVHLNHIQEEMQELRKLHSEVQNIKKEASKVDTIVNTKEYVDQKAAQVERMYGQITQKLQQVDKSVERFGELEKNHTQLQKDLDKLKMLPRMVATKRDVDSLYAFIDTLRDDSTSEDFSKAEQFMGDTSSGGHDAGEEMDKLVQWVSKSLQNGMSREDIISSAVQQGWSQSLVEQALKFVSE